MTLLIIIGLELISPRRILRRALHILLALISFSLFKNKLLSKENSGSTGPIFTIFSPYGRYLIVDYGSDLIFAIAEGSLPWQPILASKLAKSAFSPLFVAVAFGNGLKYRNSDFKKFICDGMTILYKHLVNCGPVTPEFKKGKYVHPRWSAVWLRAAPVLDLAGSVLSFLSPIRQRASLLCRACYTLGSSTHL